MDVSQRTRTHNELTQKESTQEMALNGVTRSSGSFELLGGALLFGLLGWFVDGLVGTTPLFIVVGVIAGFCISTFSLMVQYKARMASESAARAEAARR